MLGGIRNLVQRTRGSGWRSRDIEPVTGERRFGVDRRPFSAALREIGAKAILVGTESGAVFDVVESKLHPPPGLPGSVPRTALVNRLRAAGAFPVVLVVAPAGYGKTTLLSQWAARDARPFAWVSVDERDDDPHAFLKHVAAALDSTEPLGAGLIEAFERSDGPVWDAVLPRLGAEVASRRTPFVLVLDGVDALAPNDSTEAIGILIENIPPGSMIALAGRTLPGMPVATFRLAGPLLEIGPYELALSRREAEILLRSSGVAAPDETELVNRLRVTEGWAAGLRLGALAGDDRYVADYVRSECLARLDPRLLTFLRRTSILEQLSAPLCNAMLRTKGSAAELEEIERANLFVARIEHQRGWYRYHHLFRELLRHELEESEPDLVPILHRRAAAWCEAHDDPEAALHHARAAGDVDDEARILGSIAQRVHNSGRAAVVEGWLDLFDSDERLDRYPAVAVEGSSILATLGRAEEADRWLRAAERCITTRRRGLAAVRPRIAVMRATLCADGAAQMEADAKMAVSRLPADDPWRAAALLVRGAADMLTGDLDRADATLADAVERATANHSTETRAIALAERSTLASSRGDFRTADALAEEARRVIEEGELADYPTSALALAASARSSLRHGRWDQARMVLTAATRITPQLTYVLPWLAVQARIELADAYVTLRDRDGATRMLDEARSVFAVRPDLGVLAEAVAVLEHEVAAMPGPRTGGSGLTRAELRLLPLLSTHLSFREIGDRLHVSRNTIKTQAISVYRKLGASSRSEAVAAAEELGLVDVAEPKSDLAVDEALVPLVV